MNNHGRGRRPFFLLFIAAFFLVGGVVMLLWNAILPELLHVQPIRYGQALGLLVLCRILFGSFGFRGRGPGGPGRFGGGAGFRERLMSMTEEERERFKNDLKNRCS